jgi:hypothetical protein
MRGNIENSGYPVFPFNPVYEKLIMLGYAPIVSAILIYIRVENGQSPIGLDPSYTNCAETKKNSQVTIS